MCGIVGVVAVQGSLKCSVSDVVAATDLLRVRGPDNFKVTEISSTVIFGHTRLSILDLSDSSSQPFVVPGICAIVFNGEIYNFKSLRKELEVCGLEFSTSGDVEVVAKAFQHWGVECFKRFEGMWAIGIYDYRTRSVVLSRDRFGEKPLNFYYKSGILAFSSKATAILRSLSLRPVPCFGVIREFCVSGIGAERRDTWFTDIFRVAPGTFELFSESGHTTHRYWYYPNNRGFSGSFQDASVEYREIFLSAVDRACVSDVPFGVTLSSGLDSSSVISSCVFQNNLPALAATSVFDQGADRLGGLKTPKKVDESVIASKLANSLGIPWLGVGSASEQFVSNLEKCIYHLECGTVSPAVVPLWDLYRVASGRVKVMLEGQGADESLGGYVNTLIWPSFFGNIASLNFNGAFKDMHRSSESESLYFAFLSTLRSSKRFSFFKELRDWFFELDSVCRFDGASISSSRSDLFEINLSDSDAVQSVLLSQHSGRLTSLLHYGDSISMAHGVETRQPFLDRELVEFCFSLPAQFLVTNGFGKWIHRVALKGMVSDDILFSRFKMGFPTNFGTLLKSIGASSPGGVLIENRTVDRGIFDQKILSRFLDDHRRDVRNNASVLFRLLCVELWMRNFID